MFVSLVGGCWKTCDWALDVPFIRVFIKLHHFNCSWKCHIN